MSDSETPTGAGALQFDRLETATGTDSATADGATCEHCKQPIATEYFHLNGRTTCHHCRGAIERMLATPRGAGPFIAAGLFGFVGAVAGAILYSVIIMVTHFELALVAIVIGYMVGWSVRKGAQGGGRRFQVLAIGLTYFSIALAYTPLVVNEMNSRRTQQTAGQATGQAAGQGDTGSLVTSATPPAEASTRDARGGSVERSSTTASLAALPVGLAVVVLFIAALPILSIVGSLPSGLLSAVIIFAGLRQAWRMTAVPALEILGPYRVAPAVASAGATAVTTAVGESEPA